MGLIDRAKNILLKPNEEWEVIEQETPDVGGLISGYAVPLLLLSAVAMFIGVALLSAAYGGNGIVWGVVSALIIVVAGLVAVFASAYIVDALAPSFDSQKNIGRAFQLVVYSATPAWVGGIFNIIPGMGWIPMVVGLYGIYIMYLGLPHMMKTPDDKRIIYMIVAYIVVAVITAVVVGILTGILGGIILAGAAAANTVY